MNEFREKKGKIRPERVKKIFEENGSVISETQAAQITDFVYTIAETLLGRGFKDPRVNGKKIKIKNRL
jgi:hypothetical protein